MKVVLLVSLLAAGLFLAAAVVNGLTGSGWYVVLGYLVGALSFGLSAVFAGYGMRKGPLRRF